MSYPLPEALVSLITRPTAKEASRDLESLHQRLLGIVSLFELGRHELEVLIKRLPGEPPQHLLPDELENFQRGDSIEIETGSTAVSRAAPTNPLVFVCSELEETRDSLKQSLRELSRLPSAWQSQFEEELEAVLAAAPAETQEALHQYLEESEQESWESLGIVPFKEGAGLRRSYSCRLPRSLELSLSILLGHLYDTSLAESEEDEGFYKPEVEGLSRDLLYLADRFEYLATFERHGTLSPEEIQVLALAGEIHRLLKPAIEKIRSTDLLASR